MLKPYPLRHVSEGGARAKTRSVMKGSERKARWQNLPERGPGGHPAAPPPRRAPAHRFPCAGRKVRTLWQ